MSGLEVINSKDLANIDEINEQLKNETFDVNLPNGSQLIQHDVKAYDNFYSNGESFDTLKEKSLDGTLSEEGIRFMFDFKIHPEGVKKMKKVGNTIQSNTMIVQHKCVMFSYAYALTLVTTDETDAEGETDEPRNASCEFKLIPVGNTFRHPTAVTKGGYPIRMKQPAPQLNEVTLRVGPITDVLELTAISDGAYRCDTLISLESLRNLTKNGVANLRVEMTIDETYFDIDDYLTLAIKTPKVPANSARILKTILNGDKPPQADWVITVGDGEPSTFHVHGIVLKNSSPIFQAAITNHMSIGNDVLSMVSHENRFILPKIKASDMSVILTYIYQKRIVLPRFDSVSRIGQFLSHFFGNEIGEFFETWQAQLIETTMALDRKNGIETISECVKALVCVHSAPQGALFGAYNVALVVAADAWQILDSDKKVDLEKLTKKVNKSLGYDWPLTKQILEIVRDYYEAVCGVEKIRLVV